MPKLNNEESSKSELVRELIEVLKKEASLFETFLELLEEQQQALVRNDLDGINRTTERQREKTVESAILSRKREELISRITLEGCAGENITISKLIDAVSSGQAEILGRLKASILEIMEKINRTKSQNEMLIDRSRRNIARTVELLARINAPEGSYGRAGKQENGTANLALDRRA
jgi:hypothetical protein